jgi:hypothetical protein
MPDGTGESPPALFDKVPDEACFDRRRTADGGGLGCSNPQGQREGACFDPMPNDRISVRSREGSELASIPTTGTGRSLLHPDAERPDFDPVAVRIEVRFAPIRKRIATGLRFSCGRRSAPADLVPTGRSAKGPRVRRRKARDGACCVSSQGTRRALATREPDGPAEACFSRSEPGTGQASAWTGPGPETVRAWSRPQPGSPSTDRFASRRRQSRLGQWGLVATPAPIRLRPRAAVATQALRRASPCDLGRSAIRRAGAGTAFGSLRSPGNGGNST